MEWSQLVLYITVGLLAVVVLCWVANLILVLRKKDSSMLLSRVMYWTAIVAAVLNGVRSAIVYTDKSMLVACIVVLACVVISLVRLERVHKYGEPEEQTGEQTED